MRTHLDSASTRRTGPAPERTSSAGGTPRAWRMAAQDSSPITVDCPAPASRQVTTQPTRCVHPSSWLPPTSIPIFPYQKAEKSPQNQHVLSFKSYRTLRVAVQCWLLLCGAAGVLGAGPWGSSGVLRAGGAFAAGVVWCVALVPSYGCQPAISHVIPMRLVQILNPHRWNCNVFG